MNIHPVDHGMNVHRVPHDQQGKRVIGPTDSVGTGRAYAKFLAIYDDLRGLTPAVDERA